ncbi:MAG: chemotaxis protein CheW [Desulfobacteraceae bacterium]|nr:chemotaxis protein CheW [Desulfobacteraceae bacterium]
MNETFAVSGEKLLEAEDIIQMVGFVLAGELFGVDILTVQEILKQMPITSIPDSPDFIEGVINLRGNIIPIIDLRKRLNMSKASQKDVEEPWTIILNVGGRVAGFIVDRVTRVMKIPANAIQPAPDMVLSALKTQYISGVCKIDNQLMAVLDFHRILVVEEFKRMGAQKRQQDN